MPRLAPTLLVLSLLALTACSHESAPAAAESRPEPQPEPWLALSQEAARLDDAGDYLAAAAKARLALIEAEVPLKHRPARLADLLEQLGDLEMQVLEFDAAETDHLRALELRRAHFGSPSFEVAMTHNDVGQVYLEQRRDEEAEQQLLKADAMLRSLRNIGGGDRALILHNLGCAYYNLDRYDEARTAWEKVLELRLQLYGEKASSTSTTRYNLAVLAEYEDRYEEAESHYRKAIAGYEHSYGKDHPETAEARYMLADMLVTLDRPDEAVELLEPAIPVYERAYGKNHEALVEPVAALQAAYISLGRDEDARRLMHRLEVLNGEAGEESQENDAGIDRAAVDSRQDSLDEPETVNAPTATAAPASAG